MQALHQAAGGCNVGTSTSKSSKLRVQPFSTVSSQSRRVTVNAKKQASLARQQLVCMAVAAGLSPAEVRGMLIPSPVRTRVGPK